MKKVYIAPLVVGLSILFAGCGVRNEPLPMSDNNVQRLYDEVIKSRKAYVRSPNVELRDAEMQIAKNALEKKLGYSFDLTLRNVLLFYQGSMPAQVLGPVADSAAEDPQWALQRGYVSQRTLEVFKLAVECTQLTPKQLEFVGYVIACLEDHGGTCTGRQLLGFLEGAGVEAQYDKGNPSEVQAIFREMDLNGKFEIVDIVDRARPLFRRRDNDEAFGLVSLFTDNQDIPFYIDKKQWGREQKYIEMRKEEAAALAR